MTPRERYGLWGVLAGALVLRVLLVLSLEGNPFFYVPIVDGAKFDEWAYQIATRSFFGDRAFFQDPLYAYGLGIFYKVWGRDLFAARIAQCVIGTFGLWMLFEGVRRFLGYRTALTALVLGALTKTFLFYDTAILKDFLGVVAIEAALLFLCLETRWKWAAFGAALGVGALVRGNMMLLVVAAAGFLSARRQWKPAGLVLAGALAALLPVTVRNAIVEKDFVISTSHFGANLWIGNNPENTTGRYRPPSFLRVAAPEFEESDFKAEAERLNRRPMKPSEVDAYWRGRALDAIGQNFGTFLVVTGKRLLMLLNSYEIPDDYNLYFMERFSWVLRLPLFTFGLFVAPLAAAGIYLGWVERGRFAMLYVLLGAYALSILPFFIFGRYRLPLVPILIVFAAHAVVKTAQLVQWRMRQVPKTAAAVFLGALVVTHVPLPTVIGGHRDFRVAHYNLGVTYRVEGKHALAAAELEEAAKLNPEYLKDPTFVWNLGDSCEQSGRLEDAFAYYNKAAEIDRQSPEVPYRIGKIYFDRGMNERAVEKFGEALRRDPTYSAAIEPLAEAHRRLHNTTAAMEVLDRGREIAPMDWSIRLKRAEAYRERSKWPEALAAAEEVLALKPSEPTALKIRNEARAKLRK